MITIESKMTDAITNKKLIINHNDDLLEVLSTNGIASVNLNWFTERQIYNLIGSLESYIDSRVN
mgnify:FL=1